MPASGSPPPRRLPLVNGTADVRPPPCRASHPGTLASRGGTWQGPAVSTRPPSAAGGALIALGAILGAALGFLTGEATPGFLIGLAAGAALAVAIWLRDRAR